MTISDDWVSKNDKMRFKLFMTTIFMVKSSHSIGQHVICRIIFVQINVHDLWLLLACPCFCLCYQLMKYFTIQYGEGQEEDMFFIRPCLPIVQDHPINIKRGMQLLFSLYSKCFRRVFFIIDHFYCNYAND